MSLFLKYREELNLTQEELAKKANISVRTIQRIEAGTAPKGYTLDALSKALSINKELLLTKNKSTQINKKLLKQINLSSIILLIIPFGSIIMPLIIMRLKKEFNLQTKQIVSIQIIWTLSFIICIIAAALLVKLFSLDKGIIPLTMLCLIITNLYIIIRNTIEIEKRKKLHIKLNFSVF